MGALEIAWAVSEAEPWLPDAEVERALSAALSHGGRPGIALSVVFVDDEHLRQLHAEHLDDPTRTDVITFDLGEDGAGPAGELYVSLDRARRVAEQRGVAVERELSLYLVHGALHLCGFDDHAEEARRRMRAAEAEVMRALGFPADEAPHELGAD